MRRKDYSGDARDSSNEPSEELREAALRSTAQQTILDVTFHGPLLQAGHLRCQHGIDCGRARLQGFFSRFGDEVCSRSAYRRKFGHGNSRLRKIGIVALARKLLIEFWRYLETGVVPEGAVLRT